MSIVARTAVLLALVGSLFAATSGVAAADPVSDTVSAIAGTILGPGHCC